MRVGSEVFVYLLPCGCVNTRRQIAIGLKWRYHGLRFRVDAQQDSMPFASATQCGDAGCTGLCSWLVFRENLSTRSGRRRRGLPHIAAGAQYNQSGQYNDDPVIAHASASALAEPPWFTDGPGRRRERYALIASMADPPMTSPIPMVTMTTNNTKTRISSMKSTSFRSSHINKCN